MNRLQNSIENFLLKNTIWVYMAVIFFASNLMLYKGYDQTWANYLKNILKIGVIFLPILLFIYFRDNTNRKIGIKWWAGLWAMIFLIYPLDLFQQQVYRFIDIHELGKVIYLMTWLMMGIIEVIILFQKFWKKQLHRSFRFTRISLEGAIWIAMLIFSILYAAFGCFIGNAFEPTLMNMISMVITVFLILMPYYTFYWINHYILVEQLWKRKGFAFYVFGFLSTIIFLFPIASQIIYFIPGVVESNIHPVNNGDIFEEINWIVPFAGMLLSIPFIFIVRWFKQSQAITELEKQQSETELSLLKQQINPHFFFNTLNNLYALSLTKDEQTPEVILQLSELMRYVIYRGKEDKVKLAEEVKYVEDYLKLQQIRLHKQLKLSFKKDIENNQLAVPPLLFITFIENAFKHGIEPAEEDCFLYITLTEKAGNLQFSCQNSIEAQETEKGGVGLENLRRRLQLRFPEKHELRIIEEKHMFTATMKIKGL